MLSCARWGLGRTEFSHWRKRLRLLPAWSEGWGHLWEQQLAEVTGFARQPKELLGQVNLSSLPASKHSLPVSAPHPGLTQGPNGRRPLCPEQCHTGKLGLCDLARLVWRPLRSLQRPCQGSLPLGSKPGLSPVLVPTLVCCERTGRSFPPSRPPLPHLCWRRWSPRSTVETIQCWRRIKVC